MIIRFLKDGKVFYPAGKVIRLIQRSAKSVKDRAEQYEYFANHWPPKRGFSLLLKFATPRWADKERIKAIYEESRRISAESGIKHNVDHVIPIRGNLVCGLHVPENMRIILASENVRKSNKYEVE